MNSPSASSPSTESSLQTLCDSDPAPNLSPPKLSIQLSTKPTLEDLCNPYPTPEPNPSKLSFEAVAHLPQFQQLVNEAAKKQVRKAIHERRLAVVRSPRWLPRIDILDDESSERIVVTLELPGVRAGDLILAARYNAILVSGTRYPRHTSLPASASKDAAIRKFFMDQLSLCDRYKAHIDIVMDGARLRNELRYGKFERVLPLPFGTKREDITARFHEGLLVISWPRTAQTPPPTSVGSAPLSLKWLPVAVDDDRDVASIGAPIPVSPVTLVKEEDIAIF
ncbi:hypothetical protein Hypma_009493 [Hypsizygus marmoreus]|uniref:SHSP domain-containing protein n=1 Tax=Hypsizygus marmoreus TaxID=39966 RepID=A0A369JNM8_HYPMA|nr:hypothetical protein Hypma_009493 [Hypsizygus marmoreus]